MFSGCVDVAEEDANVEASGNSIFLGFDSQNTLEKDEEPQAFESEHSASSKSSGTPIPIVESDQGPSIDLLWTYECPMTKGYNVTSIDWNKTNRVGRMSAVILAEAEFDGSVEIQQHSVFV